MNLPPCSWQLYHTLPRLPQVPQWSTRVIAMSLKQLVTFPNREGSPADGCSTEAPRVAERASSTWSLKNTICIKLYWAYMRSATDTKRWPRRCPYMYEQQVPHQLDTNMSTWTVGVINFDFDRHVVDFTRFLEAHQPPSLHICTPQFDNEWQPKISRWSESWIVEGGRRYKANLCQ